MAALTITTGEPAEQVRLAGAVVDVLHSNGHYEVSVLDLLDCLAFTGSDGQPDAG